jgi:tetratricopeptide (TPR) repeat protein
LIDGRTGSTKWSQRYDLKNADMLSFEDEVASKVVDGLQIQVSPTEQKSIQQPVTTNVDAYNEYLQARYFLNEYLAYSRLNSIQNGERRVLHAISLDPKFGDAYALLAVLYCFQGANFFEDAAESLKNGEAAARDALKINPDSAEALVALGSALSEEGREGEAIPILRRAVALAPNNETAWQMLSYSYYYAGLIEEAEQGYLRVIELNPVPPQPHWMHARMLLYMGRAADAEAEMRQVVAKNPDQFKALTYFGAALYYQGKLDEAETILARANQLAGNSSDNSASMTAAFLYATRGQREKISPSLFRYRPEQVVDGDAAYWLAGIYALLGDRRNALLWLKKTIALGDVNYPWFQRDRNLDSLRADPEFQAIMNGARQRWESYKKDFQPGT